MAGVGAAAQTNSCSQALVEAVRSGDAVALGLFQDYLPQICKDMDIPGPQTASATDLVSRGSFHTRCCVFVSDSIFVPLSIIVARGSLFASPILFALHSNSQMLQ